MINIHRSLSAKLSITILLLAIPIFVISLGVLFVQSRSFVKEDAIGHANSLLNTTVQRVCRYISAVETATDMNENEVTADLHADALMTLSNRIVSLNPHMDGCSISFEPDYFPEHGRYFSVYSVRKAKPDASGNKTDTIETVIEGPYEYFEDVWYKTPITTGKPCWVTYYDDTEALVLTLDGMLSSYCKPIYDARHQMIGVISTDISLLKLSKLITAEKPFPNSYFMMTDQEGHYFIHPDSTRLFNHTIFDNTDPKQNADIIALGHEMTAGNSGNMAVTIDGVACQVCYQPVPGTSWSLALVCPDDDILDKYHKLAYIIASLIILGMFVIIQFCYRTVRHAIKPLSQLLEKTQSIASGNYEVFIHKSKRIDAVGQLQNSFATMLQSLNFHMGSLRYIQEQTKNRNEQLVQATRMVEEANRQKTTFIQNVTHQIRTPLNIIMGFTQLLQDNTAAVYAQVSDEELKKITETIKHNSMTLNRIVLMLYNSSATGLSEELKAKNREPVSCNEVARESMSFNKALFPNQSIDFYTTVADDYCIRTNRQ